MNEDFYRKLSKRVQNMVLFNALMTPPRFSRQSCRQWIQWIRSSLVRLPLTLYFLPSHHANNIDIKAHIISLTAALMRNGGNNPRKKIKESAVGKSSVQSRRFPHRLDWDGRRISKKALLATTCRWPLGFSVQHTFGLGAGPN